jgi:hypothetical protein
MASTTRKIKVKPEDARDSDTAVGTKCEPEIFREKNAEGKARKLVHTFEGSAGVVYLVDKEAVVERSLYQTDLL